MRTAAQERAIEAAYADTMACAARAWMQRAKDAERMCALLAYAAGGKIVIEPKHYRMTDGLIVDRYEDRARASTIIEARVR